MRIFNITDMARGTNVKAIHIGDFRILPGEYADVPDNIAYMNDGGHKVVLPSILALARTNQLRYEENASTNDANAGDAKPTGEDEGNAAVATEPTDEEKRKAEAAAKRAATRAANKAAKADSASKTE